ncbi:Hypothetical predicted protein [Pelobates cultripes]|uniref:Uncharacterized protein n=1 Tax=Pelobates cultripes TaxID=61616 RepID=A0AAD1RTR6_PELCU|nr:Hypothetical predicted protein [Pelobates cultripes]
MMTLCVGDWVATVGSMTYGFIASRAYYEEPEEGTAIGGRQEPERWHDYGNRMPAGAAGEPESFHMV